MLWSAYHCTCVHGTSFFCTLSASACIHALNHPYMGYIPTWGISFLEIFYGDFSICSCNNNFKMYYVKLILCMHVHYSPLLFILIFSKKRWWLTTRHAKLVRWLHSQITWIVISLYDSRLQPLVFQLPVYNSTPCRFTIFFETKIILISCRQISYSKHAILHKIQNTVLHCII